MTVVKSILHVGRTVFDFSRGKEALFEAVRGAQARYASLGVSGVTIITPQRFAQLFEGMPDTVDALFAAVQSDWSEADMRVVEERLSQDRQFAGWNMAYYGPSSYVDRHIAPLMEARTAGRDKKLIVHLRLLMYEFARETNDQELALP